MDEAGIDGAECSRKVASGRRAAGAISSLVNTSDLQLQCAIVLHETLLVPVLMYDSETILWKEKEKSRVRAIHMDILRGLLSIRRMDRVPNVQITKLCEVAKSVDERIDEGILRWFGHLKRMENSRIAKRVFVGECASSRSVGRPWKKWIDTVEECLRKKRFGE